MSQRAQARQMQTARSRLAWAPGKCRCRSQYASASWPYVRTRLSRLRPFANSWDGTDFRQLILHGGNKHVSYFAWVPR
jgi:hypothetical protein